MTEFVDFPKLVYFAIRVIKPIAELFDHFLKARETYKPHLPCKSGASLRFDYGAPVILKHSNGVPLLHFA